MVSRQRQQPPSGHGEVLCAPPFRTWPSILERNRELSGRWPVELKELRSAARSESLAAAIEYSAALRVPTSQPRSDELIMTGHQPELYHPGVWVKAFLVQRYADQTGARALDLVVDTDIAGRIELRTPCLGEKVHVCKTLLAEGGEDVAYVQLGVPDDAARTRLRVQGLASLRSLRAPALSRHFEAFCMCLDEAAAHTGDLASCLTAARRLYERPAETDYLELAVSAQVRTEAYLRYVASLILDAERFREAMNAALHEYRLRTGTRSSAQPVPDLGCADGRIETPFWVLDAERRRPLTVDRRGLWAGDQRVARRGRTIGETVDVLKTEGLTIAPKALALTLFERLFVADLFVHGTGGARYDQVTDDIVSRYYGIPAPGYAVASMTMLLPLGATVAGPQDVAAVENRLHRFTHNPDQVLAEVEFDTVEERVRAEDLAREKRELVAAIAYPAADRKALGSRIREVNEDLATLLQPMVIELSESLVRMRAERDAADVLMDRTYPYCLWDPREVMDKVG